MREEEKESQVREKNPISNRKRKNTLQRVQTSIQTSRKSISTPPGHATIGHAHP